LLLLSDVQSLLLLLGNGFLVLNVVRSSNVEAERTQEARDSSGTRQDIAKRNLIIFVDVLIGDD